MTDITPEYGKQVAQQIQSLIDTMSDIRFYQTMTLMSARNRGGVIDAVTVSVGLAGLHNNIVEDLNTVLGVLKGELAPYVKDGEILFGRSSLTKWEDRN